MENTANIADRSAPRQVEILLDALTPGESEVLRNFILDKLPHEGVVELLYRPDEWDSEGVIQKVQDLAKDHIKNTFVTINQLEPRGFRLARISNHLEWGEEYSKYNSNGEIIYQVTATVSNNDICNGGSTVYVNTGIEVPHANGTTVAIHRAEELNDWKLSHIYSGHRLDLIIYIQEFDKQKSYDYPIDQITEDLPDF